MITCIGKQFMLDISSSSEATESFGGLHSEFTVGFARNENILWTLPVCTHHESAGCSYYLCESKVAEKLTRIC